MNGSTNESTDGQYQARHTAARDATVLRLAPHVSDDDIGTLPPVLGLLQAAAMLGLGRTTAYRLVAEELWPTPVVRLGRLIKIPTQPLLELLSGAWPPMAIERSASAAARSFGGPVVRRG